MRALSLIVSRELMAYLKGSSGWIVAALILMVDGLLFNAFALGAGERLSAEVLSNFFYLSAGTTMIAAVLLSMRLIAEERHDETLVLLYTAPISDWHIAVGKWLSSFIFLCLVLILSLYMPAMIAVNGSLSVGHLAAGYLGLALLGGACTALGTFASSLTRSQVVAAILGGALVVGLLIQWLLSKVVDPPFDTLLAYLALFDKHFTPFQKGEIHTRSVVYYLSVIFFALLATRHVLGARRWQ